MPRVTLQHAKATRFVCAAGLGLVVASGSAGAQPSSRAPLKGSIAWVLDAFYARPSFPAESSYVSPDVARRTPGGLTVGASLSAGARVRSRILQAVDTLAVTATTVTNAGHTQDWYTYLRRLGPRWCIVAVRSVIFPPQFYAALDSLRGRPLLSDTANIDLHRMELTIEPDSTLKLHLQSRQPDFARLVQLFAEQHTFDAIDDRGVTDPPAEHSHEVEELRATYWCPISLNR
jgi:hypothetical protein